MDSFSKKIEVRWSDLDPNYHLRHSVYYDYAAFARIDFLNARGLDVNFFLQHDIGPILFREECIFKREIKLGDVVTINVEALKARMDYSRWSIVHQIIKEGEVAAILTVDGAWIDTRKRKLTVPPPKVKEVFDAFPKAKQFEWLD